MQFSIPGGNFLRKSGGTMGGLILMGGNDIDDIGSLNPGGPGLTTGPLWGDEHPHLVKKVASANLRHSHDAQADGATVDPAFSVAKTITFANGLLGGARVSFEIRSSDGITTVKGKLMKNGSVLIGVVQSTTNNAFQLKTQDVTLDFVPGDALELLVNVSGAAVVSVQNFRLSYDDAATVAVSAVNS